MIYFKDARVTIWEVEDQGNYSLVKMSSSRKDKKTDEYKNSNWAFVRFVGDAHKKASDLNTKDHILVNGGFSLEAYEKDGEKAYPKSAQIVVFNFGYPEDSDAPRTTKSAGKSKMDTPPVVEDDSEENLPF